MDKKLGTPSRDTDAIADRALYNCFIVIDFRLRDFLGGNGNGFALSFLRLCLMDRFRSMQIDGAGLDWQRDFASSKGTVYSVMLC